MDRVQGKTRILALALAAMATLCLAAPAGSLTYGDYDEPVQGKVAGMVFVEGGCFVMGDSFGDGDPDERPQHKVCVDDYYLGKFEVTVGAFSAFVNATGYVTDAERYDGCLRLIDNQWVYDPGAEWRHPGFEQTAMSPVACVTYYDAMEFMRYKSAKAGVTYRLPSEAEWEFAARSRGMNFRYPWGLAANPAGNFSDESVSMASMRWDRWRGHYDGHIYSSPIASYAPNLLGVYDLSGNLWEWIDDYYQEDYYSKSPRNDPAGAATGFYRVIRGGGWFSKEHSLRTSEREALMPNVPMSSLGFRLAITP